ncbi:MAG: hypothetical protein JSR36_15730 [Proteobacteria bacterium]|nr:hypothetical protein [Pseudomonadota bacterium]
MKKQLRQSADRRGMSTTHGALRAISLLGVVAFWMGLLMAGHLYPSEYDWRYMTMSNLVYPERNPAGHLWASGGIVLCGLSGLYWTTALLRRAHQAGERSSRVGTSALRVGFFSMACCAVLPERLWPIPKAHEFLALTAFLCLCLGMAYQSFRTVGEFLVRQQGSSTQGTRRYAGLAVAVPLAPVLLAGLVQLYVARRLPQLPWVGLAWRDLGVPRYLSFAFWEWVACALFSASIVLLGLITRER